MCALQLTFLGQIYEWLDKGRQQPDSVLAGALDLSNVALAGHSRGGKLAALQFANGMTWQLPHTSFYD